jgi:hypothetical protein
VLFTPEDEQIRPQIQRMITPLNQWSNR